MPVLKPGEQAEVLCARPVHLPHDTLGYLAVDLVEKGSPSLEDLGRRHIMDVA